MFLACLLTHALPINTLPIEARLTPWLLGEVLRVKGDLHDFATPFMVFFVTDSFAGVYQWQTPVVKACYYFATHPRLTLAVFCLSAVVCVLSRSKPIIHTAIRLASLIFSCKYRTIGPTIALIDTAGFQPSPPWWCPMLRRLGSGNGSSPTIALCLRSIPRQASDLF